jgi:hypothetical protein
MMLTLMMTAVLAQAWMDEPVEAPAGPLISGVYAELQASGHSGCNTAGIPRSLDIDVLAQYPHPRSRNIGEMAYALGRDPALGGSFTVSGQPALTRHADGRASVSLGGGWINTAGRYEQGVSDGQLRGRVTVELERQADGRLRLVSLTRTERRDGEGDILVADGRLADGTELRLFERCGAANLLR